MNIIDIENGSFTLNSGMVLKARQHFEDVDRFAIPKTVTDMKNGYEWIYFSNLKIENLYFNLSVCFFKQKAKFITFSFSDSDSDPTAKSWSDWIETDEEKKSKNLKIGSIRPLEPKGSSAGGVYLQIMIQKAVAQV